MNYSDLCVCFSFITNQVKVPHYCKQGKFDDKCIDSCLLAAIYYTGHSCITSRY